MTKLDTLATVTENDDCGYTLITPCVRLHARYWAKRVKGLSCTVQFSFLTAEIEVSISVLTVTKPTARTSF